jgi:ABC-type antimicrobial peptide transport system permease subunit
MSSLAGEAARRLRSNPGAMCALFLSLSIVALTLVGPWFNPNGSESLDWLHVASQPAL